MFFADSTGLFSLICLWIQCLLAWTAAVYFAVMVEPGAPWLRDWRRAFVGLGVALTALSVRFLLAHQFAIKHTLDEGALSVRLCYGGYLGGKVAFIWFLLKGVSALRRRAWPSARVLTAFVFVASLMGVLLPTIESIMLVQAPWFVFGCLRAAAWLRRGPDEEPEAGRALVRTVLHIWAVAWVVYGIAVIAVGPIHPGESSLVFVLRINSIIDLAVQVSLASGLIMLVMSDARRVAIAALQERDRLRDQVRRDEKVRALSTLVGGIAHEINNPLTAMLGFGEDLLAADAETRERAARIVLEQAERCRAIVRRMSTIGRHAAIEIRPLDVGERVRQVVADLAGSAEALGVPIEIDIQAITVAADGIGFDLVLGNLLRNAIQVSPRGARVRVGTRVAGDGVDLVVEDHGPGVAEELRSVVFEPFWTTRSAGEGVGLGLAVVATLVSAHGGSVRIGDAPGGGAQFTVHWPGVALRAAVAQRGGPERWRLLIIDDEPLVRMMIARQAKREGWITMEVASADEAARMLLDERADFEAIVCDLRMPGLSGSQFHDVVAERAPELLKRFVFVTGDLASAESVAFARRCAAPILGKPFLASELCARLREVARGA